MGQLPNGTVVKLKPLRAGFYGEVYCNQKMQEMSKEEVGGVIYGAAFMLKSAYRIHFAHSNEVSIWVWCEEMFDVIHIPK